MAMHVALVRDKLLLCGATEIWGCLFLQQSLALPDWHTLSHLQGTHPLRAKGWVNTAPYPCLVGRPWEGSVMASWNGPGEAELPSCRCGVCSMPDIGRDFSWQRAASLLCWAFLDLAEPHGAWAHLGSLLCAPLWNQELPRKPQLLLAGWRDICATPIQVLLPVPAPRLVRVWLAGTRPAES